MMRAKPFFASWILHGLPEDERRMMAATFDSLPGDVTDAVASELALTPDNVARGVPEEALRSFAATEVGRTLITAWRGKAAKKLVVVDRRLSRIEERLSDEGLQAAREWFACLSPQAKVNVMWFLAG